MPASTAASLLLGRSEPVREAGTNAQTFDPVLTLATAEDLAAGMADIVEETRIACGAAGAEWWAIGDDGISELVAATGAPRGVRLQLALADTGVFVVHGAR